jgi:UDP-N-acetylmuramoyl-tripeptide--D-alanyl-D-alanine ligase
MSGRGTCQDYGVELRLSEIAHAVDGRLVGPDSTVAGASIDSRSIEPGQLFVPIVAERDGHEFIAAALEKGAGGYLTARPSVDAGAVGSVLVKDTAESLAALGRYVRDRFDRTDRPGEATRVAGVTGSVGKTTVKDLLAAVLSADRPTWASERSFNNELGVPLTLLNAPAGSRVVVVEMGARGAGHIKDLCDIARPTMGLVTRVAAVHTELFGGLDDVAAAKGELISALPEDGVAVLNAADERVLAMAHNTQAEVVTFGDGGEVRADDVVLDAELCPAFRLRSRWGSADVRLGHARGLHMVENALAASAGALALGVPVETVAAALEDAELSPWRMELVRSAFGGVILNDAYNANPTSMTAALRSLAALPAERRVAVLGVMAELGPISDAEHRAVGELAAELGVEVVAVDVAAYGGTLVSGIDEAAAAVGVVEDGVAVLVKGSRVAGLERLAQTFA